MSAGVETARVHTVIQCAVPVELEALRQTFKSQNPRFTQNPENGETYEYFQTGKGVVCARCGMGGARAGAACEFAIRHWSPKLHVDFGIAGALVPALLVGDLVFANKVVHAAESGARALGVELQPGLLHEVPFYPDFRIFAGLRVSAGPLISVDEEVVTAEERADLHTESGAIAVTWETAAIARACATAGTEFLSARMISDRDETDFEGLRSPATLLRLRDAADSLAVILKLHG